MNYRDVLSLTLVNMIEEGDPSTREMLLTCTLVDQWFHTFCRVRLDYLSSKAVSVNAYLGAARRQFAFFTLDYIQRKTSFMPLTLRHLSTTMINVAHQLGKGYSISLSSSSESGFTLATPDGRQCEVRFSNENIAQRNGTMISIRGLSVRDIQKLDDAVLDIDLLRCISRYTGQIMSENSIVALYPKSYLNDQGATVWEYRVICECFGAATGTRMTWDSERIWREKLTPFQEWMVNNRHRFRTQSNIKFVTDNVVDEIFPHSDPNEMLSYLQWSGADQFAIQRFLVIYGTYETEILGTTFVKNLSRCSFCNTVCDIHEHSVYRIYCGCEAFDNSFSVCDCQCFECVRQTRECSDHWLPNNPNFCRCGDEEDEDFIENYGEDDEDFVEDDAKRMKTSE